MAIVGAIILIAVVVYCLWLGSWNSDMDKIRDNTAKPIGQR